jgi:CBS domain-containing protein
MDPVEASSCCTAQDTTAQAAQTMRNSGCGCAPVVEDTESLELVGVVTERDVCCGVAANDRRASEVRVEEIMLPSSLHDHHATSLPVVDAAGSCCGTVSIHSLERS